VLLFAVGVVATVGTQDTWLDGYGIIAYFLVPLTFVPLTAVALASPRANRFVPAATGMGSVQRNQRNREGADCMGIGYRYFRGKSHSSADQIRTMRNTRTPLPAS
jgi:hypothetical protein